MRHRSLTGIFLARALSLSTISGALPVTWRVIPARNMEQCGFFWQVRAA